MKTLGKGILTCLLLFMLPAQGWAEEEVKIGVIAPLTGGLADRGEEIRRTVEVFQLFYLAKPSRYRYQFLIEDGKNGLGNSATSAAHKFIDIDGVRFLITGTSGETIQAGMVAQRRHVVTIGVLAVVPEIRSLGDYIFRTYVDIERGLKRMVAAIQTQAGGFALLSEETPYTAGIEKILLSVAAQSITFKDNFPADNIDFRTLLLRLKAKSPKAVYLNCASPKTFIPLVRQIKQLGLNQPLYSYFMPAEPEVRAALGPLLEGIVFLDTPPVENPSSEFADFMRAYLKQYPDGPRVEFLLRSTHDALRALIYALEAVGLEAAKVKDYLYKLKFQGALGEVAFDEMGDVVNLDFVLKTVRDGNIEMLPAVS